MHLADGTRYLPADQPARTRVHRWICFEQSRIEPELSVRALPAPVGASRADTRRCTRTACERGRDALAALDRGLSDGREFVAGEGASVADIALYAYVHCAADAGAEPRERAHIGGWLDRVEAQPGSVNDLEPLPEHASARPV